MQAVVVRPRSAMSKTPPCFLLGSFSSLAACAILLLGCDQGPSAPVSSDDPIALETSTPRTVTVEEVCPEHARYAPNGVGQGYCLFEDIELPEADVSAYCHYLEYGYIGFSWTESAATAGYTCPDGSYYAPNGAGTGYCVFDDLGLPEADGLSAYCYYLEYGYLGYSWDLCPEGTRYTTNGAGTAFCLWEEVELPEAPDLQAYCYYVEDGYLGFHWTDTPATAGYQCPEGARQTDNGAGLSFCLFEDLGLPPGDDLQPYCDYLDDGYFGYSWSL